MIAITAKMIGTQAVYINVNNSHDKGDSIKIGWQHIYTVDSAIQNCSRIRN